MCANHLLEFYLAARAFCLSNDVKMSHIVQTEFDKIYVSRIVSNTFRKKNEIKH